MNRKLKLEYPDKLFGLDVGLMIIFIKPLALFVVLIAVFNLVVFPWIGEFENGMKMVESNTNKEKDYRQKINYLLSIDQDSLQRDEILVSSALFPEQNAYFLVNVIKKIAGKYGYSVDSFSISMGELDSDKSVVGGAGYMALPISLDLIGPANSYYELALGLERSLPLLKLNTFDMKRVSEVATIKLDVTGYYISEKKLVEADKLTLADLTLKETETKLLSTLNDYQVVDNILEISGSFAKQKEFVKYDRADPFSQ